MRSWSGRGTASMVRVEERTKGQYSVLDTRLTEEVSRYPNNRVWVRRSKGLVIVTTDNPKQLEGSVSIIDLRIAT